MKLNKSNGAANSAVQKDTRQPSGKSAELKNRHFKRNIIAIASAAVILTCGGAGIFSYQLSQEFDLRAEEICKNLSQKQVKVEYTPDETGWLFFRKQGVFTVSGKLQNGDDYVSELALEAYVLPSKLQAEIKLPADGHPAIKQLRELGVKSFFLDADFNAAKLQFRSESDHPFDKKMPEFGGQVSTAGVMGVMDIPYNSSTSAPLALTVGATEITYTPDFYPAAKVKLGELTYTAPAVSFLQTADLTAPLFSILQIGKISVSAGAQAYQFNNLKLERSLIESGNREHNDFSVYLGPGKTMGSVELDGENLPLGADPNPETLTGQYVLNLNGAVFTELDHPIFTALLKQGFVTKTENKVTANIDVAKGQIKLNGKPFDLDLFMSGVLSSQLDMPAVPKVPAPIIKSQQEKH